MERRSAPMGSGESSAWRLRSLVERVERRERRMEAAIRDRRESMVYESGKSPQKQPHLFHFGSFSIVLLPEMPRLGLPPFRFFSLPTLSRRGRERVAVSGRRANAKRWNNSQFFCLIVQQTTHYNGNGYFFRHSSDPTSRSIHQIQSGSLT